jgi:hypothetical protein
MVARIAPSPIVTSVASSDPLTQAVAANFSPTANGQFNGGNGAPVSKREIAQAALPPPPAPPGEAFAAAVIAGQLAPRPNTPEQLRQRLGSAWQPPASPLRLMDRSA